MFAALYLPSLPGRMTEARAQLLGVAREFSPRIEQIGEALALDLTGLGRWFDGPRALGEALRRTAADRGLAPHVAVAATRTAALVAARARAGLTVVPPGEEPARLAVLPLGVLAAVQCLQDGTAPGVGRRRRADTAGTALPLATLRRWGLRTLGDLASLPPVEVAERLGQAGVVWQRLARGEDLQPLVPAQPAERFEESIDFEWPIEGFEPLSFVLGRLFDALSARLEQADRGVAVLHVRLDLVGRDRFARALHLPAPMRDARTLRTLALLDLEGHPPPSPIERVTVAADVVEGRVQQFSLLARALPVERASTLLARLSALAGAECVGAPALVDSHRPGAFTMVNFEVGSRQSAVGSVTGNLLPTAHYRLPTAVIRRFRHPIPARVEVHQGRPVRVTTDRRHLRGGYVEDYAGPWRSSGDWWMTEQGRGPTRPEQAPAAARAWGRGPTRPEQAPAAARAWGRGPTRPEQWSHDEWDVLLRDGTRYVVVCDRRRGGWFLDGMLD